MKYILNIVLCLSATIPIHASLPLPDPAAFEPREPGLIKDFIAQKVKTVAERMSRESYPTNKRKRNIMHCVIEKNAQKVVAQTYALSIETVQKMCKESSVI